MQAIILAAGMGKRLGRLTRDKTKGLLKVNGKTIIEQAIEALRQAKIDKIIIVTGFQAEGLTAYLDKVFPELEIIYINNPIFDKTNNIYSLWLTKEYLQAEDTLLLESDIVFEAAIIQEMLDNPNKNIALVSKMEPWMDGTVTLLDDELSIISVIEKKHIEWADISAYYKTVNIYKFSKEFSRNHYLPFMEAYLTSVGNNEYYEQVIRILAFLNHTELKGHPISSRRWYEIDDIHDLQIAETLFATQKKILDLMNSRYGGFWRFPEMMDFCYLVNPHFPTPKMWQEMQASFKEVTSQYPSGMKVQSVLAAKIFSCDPERILVGNGAAELIAKLFETIPGKVGIVEPCFNEYPARIGPERALPYQGQGFIYSPEELIANWKSKVEWAVIVNPDNPTGHFWNQETMLSFLDSCQKESIRPIIDESFVDFANPDRRYSLINDQTLEKYPDLIVIRSISKSYGIPGLRLGVLASADTKLIKTLKKAVPVWNINSPGEYFMQIFSKHTKDYQHSCDLLAQERQQFSNKLESINGFAVLPSQANYLLCQVTNGLSARQITEKLFLKANILIKDLTGKPGFTNGEYIRIAIRDQQENDYLINTLKAICEETS